ncbi:MAG: hypothetical protein PVH13_01495 [Gammaproteobacteria bacterium]|jgi:hypothetical protein
MRLQRLTMTVLAGCCLLVAPIGVAIASCDDGLLLDETFDGDLRVTSEDFDCSIIGSTIAGDLIVTNVNNVLLLNNTVGGRIRVEGNAKTGTANVAFNTVLGGNLYVGDMADVKVIENETLTGSIRVIANISAFVEKNISGGNIRCRTNTEVKAFFNFAKGSVSGQCAPASP